MSTNIKQSMADHEHGLRFVDDEGRCLACCVKVRDAELTALRARLAEVEKMLKVWENGWGEPTTINNERARAEAAEARVMDLVSESAVDALRLRTLRAKSYRQRTELRRLNHTLRTFWEGVRWSHQNEAEARLRARVRELEADLPNAVKVLGQPDAVGERPKFGRQGPAC